MHSRVCYSFTVRERGGGPLPTAKAMKKDHDLQDWTPCPLVANARHAHAVGENDHSHWKAFKESLLTHSSAHYLNVIAQLHKEKGYVRLTDVARSLGISKAAASQGIGALKTRGYVVEDEARMLSLSDEGVRLANAVEHNFMVVAAFFHLVLGIDAETANTDACKLEHLLSPQTSMTLACFVKTLLEDEQVSARLAKKVQTMLQRFEDAEVCPFSHQASDAGCPYLGDPVLCRPGGDNGDTG